LRGGEPTGGGNAVLTKPEGCRNRARAHGVDSDLNLRSTGTSANGPDVTTGNALDPGAMSWANVSCRWSDCPLLSERSLQPRAQSRNELP
jgi:hypothetical protein